MLFNKYKDDYKQVQSVGLDGKLRTVTFYDGSYYELPYDEKQFKKNKITCLIFSIMFLLIYLMAGYVNTDSSKTAWIVFPYLFIFLPIAFDIFAVINLFGLKSRMERAGYEASILRLKNSSIAIIVLTILNIVLDLIFIILNRYTLNFVLEISYIVLLLILIISVIAFGKKYDKMFGGVVLNSNQ